MNPLLEVTSHPLCLLWTILSEVKDDKLSWWHGIIKCNEKAGTGVVCHWEDVKCWVCSQSCLKGRRKNIWQWLDWTCITLYNALLGAHFRSSISVIFKTLERMPALNISSLKLEPFFPSFISLFFVLQSSPSHTTLTAHPTKQKSVQQQKTAWALNGLPFTNTNKVVFEKAKPN